MRAEVIILLAIIAVFIICFLYIIFEDKLNDYIHNFLYESESKMSNIFGQKESKMSNDENCTSGGKVALFILGGLLLFILFCMWGCPQYEVYSKSLSGKAQLAESNSNRMIAINEAKAKEESAKFLAQAEITRAEGVAKANRIIGESLRNNESYLRYLWIHNLEMSQASGSQVIYVPTEANLPILEASKRK